MRAQIITSSTPKATTGWHLKMKKKVQCEKETDSIMATFTRQSKLSLPCSLGSESFTHQYKDDASFIFRADQCQLMTHFKIDLWAHADYYIQHVREFKSAAILWLTLKSNIASITWWQSTASKHHLVQKNYCVPTLASEVHGPPCRSHM